MRGLIVGASRVGVALAEELMRGGHDVRLLDPSAQALAALPASVAPRAVLGSPLEELPLTESAVACDAVAAVTEDDAVNAVVALAARQRLRVPLAVAVVASSGRAEALAGLGVHVLCPTTRTARDLHLMLVRSGIESELLVAGRIAVCRADVPAHLAGRTLGELARPGELIPIAVERDGRAIVAVPGLVLAAGDVVHAATTERERLAELMRP